MNDIQQQFASAFANGQIPNNMHSGMPPVQVVVPPQASSMPWKWIAIFLIGVLLVVVVVVFIQKNDASKQRHRIHDVLMEEKKKKPTTQLLEQKEQTEEQDIGEEPPESYLSAELQNDNKFTSMAEIVRQKKQGTLK